MIGVVYYDGALEDDRNDYKVSLSIQCITNKHQTCGGNDQTCSCICHRDEVLIRQLKLMQK